MKANETAHSLKRSFPHAKGRKDDDVIKHGKGPAVPNQQWEMNVDLTPQGNDRLPHASFLPMAGKDRAVPHVKLNECDH